MALILKDYGFASLLNLEPAQLPADGNFGSGYRADVEVALDNFGRRDGYAFTALADVRGTPRLTQPASASLRAGELWPLFERFAAHAVASRRPGERLAAAGNAAVGGQPYRVVVQQALMAYQSHWLLMAFALDEELQALHQGLRVHATLVPHEDASRAAVFTTLEDARATAATLAAAEADRELETTKSAVMSDVGWAQQTLQRLAAMGCDEGRVRYFAKPMPADALGAWAQAHRQRLARAAVGPMEDSDQRLECLAALL